MQFTTIKEKRCIDQKNVCAVYIEGTPGKFTAGEMVRPFCSSNFYAKDEQRSGHPHTKKVKEILEKGQQDIHTSISSKLVQD